MPGKYCNPNHSWLNVDPSCGNWRNNYDGDQQEMVNRAGPMRQLAESINRCLGRYPMTWAAMAWPITANGAVAGEQNGSAPLANFGRFDLVPNHHEATVRVSTLTSGTNST